jgi:hypothetical protein
MLDQRFIFHSYPRAVEMRIFKVMLYIGIWWICHTFTSVWWIGVDAIARWCRSISIFFSYPSFNARESLKHNSIFGALWQNSFMTYKVAFVFMALVTLYGLAWYAIKESVWRLVVNRWPRNAEVYNNICRGYEVYSRTAHSACVVKKMH